MPLYRDGARIAKLYRGATPIARAYRAAVKVHDTEEGAPAWSPADLPGLVAWYRSDLGVTDASGAASAWADQSGNGVHLSEGTAGNRPAIVPALFNGIAGLRFDGSNDRLSSGAISRAIPYHMFVVARQVSWSAADSMFGLQTSGSSRLFQNSSSPRIYQAGNAAAVNFVSPSIGATFFLSSFFNGAGSYQALNNGSIVGPANHGNETMNIIRVGARGDLSNFANVEFAEIIICSSEVTGADLTALRAYINERYALW
jgi:hypothetical protein